MSIGGRFLDHHDFGSDSRWLELYYTISHLSLNVAFLYSSTRRWWGTTIGMALSSSQLGPKVRHCNCRHRVRCPIRSFGRVSLPPSVPWAFGVPSSQCCAAFANAAMVVLYEMTSGLTARERPWVLLSTDCKYRPSISSKSRSASCAANA